MKIILLYKSQYVESTFFSLDFLVVAFQRSLVVSSRFSPPEYPDLDTHSWEWVLVMCAKHLRLEKMKKQKFKWKRDLKKGLKKINFQDEKIETEKPKNKKKRRRQ